MQEQLKLCSVVLVNISCNKFCKILQNCDMPPKKGFSCIQNCSDASIQI
jgi:hypothetical protein